MSTTIDPELSLGELALAQPGLARIFDELQLDYCCGGAISLADAAAQHGLDARTLVFALEAEARANGEGVGERDWREVPLAELCRHIVVRHHAFLRRELPHIEELLEKVVARHGATVPTLVGLQSDFQDLHGDLLDHIDNEEQNLFPLCEELEADPELGEGVMAQLRMHETAHSDVGEALARMRELAGGYDTAAALCTTHGVMLEALRGLELDLHQHIHEENNVLFRRLRGELGEPAAVGG